MSRGGSSISGKGVRMYWIFVWFDSLRPMNNLSVIKGRVYPGWTSTKLGLMILPQDTTKWRRCGSKPRPLGLESSTLPLSHCAPDVGVHFADFISFFLNILWKWNNLVLLRPNYFILIGYLITGGVEEGLSPEPPLDPPLNLGKNLYVRASKLVITTYVRLALIVKLGYSYSKISVHWFLNLLMAEFEYVLRAERKYNSYWKTILEVFLLICFISWEY